jgi:radical SAM superfamily enzyme YgiQ (UPF0313 family)
MRIALVNPPGNVLVDEHLEPPLGLMSIASYVQQHLGMRPQLFDLTEFSIEEAQAVLLRQEFDVYGFSVYCTKWNITKDLVDQIRREYGSHPLIIAGGPNPTAMPEFTLTCEGIDVVVVGEGEKAFVEIIKAFQKGDLRPGEQRLIHGHRLSMKEFPILDRSLVPPPEKYSRVAFGKPVVALEASRGCANHCIFCNSVVMGGGSNGIVVKSLDTLIKEITQSKDQGYSVFKFNDDSFNYAASKTGILRQLEPLSVRYRIYANAKNLTRDLLKHLKDTGCFHISIGVESYNPENLSIVGKNTTQEEIRSGINTAAELGIIVRAFFIVGLPYDTDETVKEFMTRAAREINFQEYTVYPLIPYPGTPLWKAPSQYGYRITDYDINNYLQIGRGKKQAIVLRHQNFNESDIQRWLDETESIFLGEKKTQTFYSAIL